MGKWIINDSIKHELREVVDFYKALYAQINAHVDAKAVALGLKRIKARFRTDSLKAGDGFAHGLNTAFQLVDDNYPIISINVQSYPLCCGIVILSNLYVSDSSFYFKVDSEDLERLKFLFLKGMLSKLSWYVGAVGLLEIVTVDDDDQTDEWAPTLKKLGFEVDKTIYNPNSGNNLTIWHGITINENNTEGVDIGILKRRDEEEDEEW